MARRSGPVALVVASILVLAIPVVMMAVSPHRDRGASNVQIQFAAGDKQAPAAQSQGKVGTSTAGTAQPATGRQGGAGAGSAPGRQGGGTGSTKSGRAGGGSSVQGTSTAGGSPSDTYLRKPARAPVQGGGDSVMIGDPNPSSPFPVPATSGLPVPSVSVPAINLHTVPKPHKFVLSKWIARCDVSSPGKPGTMAFDVYYQQHPSGSYGFPVDQQGYPCGSDWAIIPGSDPFTPPVWIGKTAPFVPATNYPGGQIFTAVDVSASQVAADLAAAGVPVGGAGAQLLTYGSDGVPVYTSSWWGLTLAVKNAAGQAIFHDGGYPHNMWRTDAYHWGWGNLGVGLPAFKGKV